VKQLSETSSLSVPGTISVEDVNYLRSSANQAVWCTSRNMPQFRTMFLKLIYTGISQPTHTCSWRVGLMRCHILFLFNIICYLHTAEVHSWPNSQAKTNHTQISHVPHEVPQTLRTFSTKIFSSSVSLHHPDVNYMSSFVVLSNYMLVSHMYSSMA
jgi:hypothetical protein